MNDGAYSAIHHLARVLLEQGVLDERDILNAADGVDSDGESAADHEREGYAHAAHVLRCAILYAGRDDPKPPRPSLRIVESD